MEQDSKNRINEFVSSTVDEIDVQIPMKESIDRQMFVPSGTRQVWVPAGDQRQTYVLAGSQNQQPLNAGFNRQMPIGGGFNNQIGVNVGFSRQVPIQLKNRTIDLLDMEQCGHNSSFLRKPMTIGVLDATQVNSDYEYGVIQIEDNYEFTNISGETVTDSEWTVTSLSPSIIEDGSVVNDFSLESSAIVVTGNIMMLPNIVQTKVGSGKSIYGLQCLSMDASVPTWKIGTQSVTVGGTALLNANKMTGLSPLMSFNTNGFDGHQLASIKIKNLEVAGATYAASVSVIGFNPGSTSTSTVANPGDSLWHEASVGSVSGQDLGDISFVINVYVKNLSGTYELLYSKTFAYQVKNRDDNGDVNWFESWIHTYPFDNSILGSKTWHHGTIAETTDLLNTMPQCQLIVKTIHDGETTEHFINITNSVALSANPMNYISNHSTASPTVMDWSYGIFSNAYTFSGVSNFKPILIKSSGLDFYMITESNSVVGFQNKTDRSVITKFYMMSQVSSLLSIGIVQRADNTYQIGIKHNGKYYTAMYDTPVDVIDFTVKDLRIINSNEACLDFVIKYETYSVYYNFFRSDMIEGNKLLPGSRMLYIFSSNRVDSLINKDEVVNLSSTGHELPVLQCSVVGTDPNVYSRITKSFPVPLVIDGSNVKNTVFVVNTTYGLRNSIVEMSGAGKFVVDNLTMYMPNCLVANLFIGYGGGATVPIYSAGLSGSLYKHIATLPSYNKELSNFTSAPLKMEDEYPEVHNNASIGDATFVLGKTRFVSVGGSVYESGSLAMCPNSTRLHIYENDARLFVQSGFFFLAKDRQTNVYTFTELGTQIVLVIEDKILCNPIRTGVGIVAVGSRGIWLIGGVEGRTSIKKIYSSPFTVEQASLKTNLDNSAMAILDGSDSWTYDVMTTTDQTGNEVMSSDGYHMATGIKEFVMVCINQFGHVSHQKIYTALESANLIDIGSTSELLVIDLVGTNNINVLSKKVDAYGQATFGVSDVFVLQCVQLMEQAGMSVQTELNVIEVFAKGTGTIVVSDSSTGTAISTISVSSSSKYKSYIIRLDKMLNMLELTITVGYGVKLLQRIIGTVISKEVLNA